MRRLLTITSSLAVLAGVAVLGSAPAFAAVTGSLCTASASNLCVDSPNFNYGTSMTSSGSGSRTITFSGTPGSNGTLELTGANAPADRCLESVANTYNLEIGHCSDTGTSWTFLDNGDGTRSFESVHYSGRLIAGDNVSGDVVIAKPKVSGDGYYYRWLPL